MALRSDVLEIRENKRKLKEKNPSEKFMRAALKEAQKAYAIGEVPIGCVIVQNDKIIARGYNRRNADKSVLCHAEMSALKKACKKLGDWRLEDCEMYVTLEPCPMCAGAIVQSRIPKVIYGCDNPKAGCAGSVLNILQVDKFNHRVDIEKGLLMEECSKILKQFFSEMRRNLREEKIDKKP